MSNKTKQIFRYCQRSTLNTTAAGLTGVAVFSANSMFDPDVTGIGHQPRMYDQVMPLYDHYQVIGANIKVGLGDPVGSGAVMFGVAIRDSATVSADYLDYVEDRSGNVTYGTSCQDQILNVEANYSQKKFFGDGSLEDQYSGQITTNPTERAYFHVFIANLNAAASTATDILVTIDYIAILTEPHLPGAS